MTDQPEPNVDTRDDGHPEPPTEEEMRAEPGPDLRQPAYDAVYAYIRGLGGHLPPHPVHRNAIIWRAVQAALDATPVGRCISSHCVEGNHILIPTDEIDGEQPARTTPNNPAASNDTADNPLRDALAAAIYEHNSPGRRWANAHPDDVLAYGFDADAALCALDKHLDIGDAEAWCKTCRRVWGGPGHRCETDAERRLARVRDLRNDLRDITGARWIAEALDTILDQPMEAK